MKTYLAGRLLAALFVTSVSATSTPTIEIKAGRLCIKPPTGLATCLYKNEWQDRLKAMQEYMREHDAELSVGRSHE